LHGIDAYRRQVRPFGARASETTTHRVIKSIDEQLLDWVAEPTDHVDVSAWPHRSRLAVRRERPRPGAQLRIFDEHGDRHACFLTSQDGEDLAVLELRHRGRARGSTTAVAPARTPASATFPTTLSSATSPGSISR
jgi:hypothetical protein